jgi:hypothetical protein
VELEALEQDLAQVESLRDAFRSPVLDAGFLHPEVLTVRAGGLRVCVLGEDVFRLGNGSGGGASETHGVSGRDATRRLSMR